MGEKARLGNCLLDFIIQNNYYYLYSSVSEARLQGNRANFVLCVIIKSLWRKVLILNFIMLIRIVDS